MSGSLFSIPETPFLSLRSFYDGKYRKSAKTKRFDRNNAPEGAKEQKERKQKHKKSSLSSSSMSLSVASSSSDWESQMWNMSRKELEHKARKKKSLELMVLVQKTVKKHLVFQVDY